MHFNIQIFVSLSKIYYLCRHKEQHIWGCVGLIGILIKLFQKTEIVSFVNGGPYKSLLKEAKLQSRWITKTENTQIFFSSEFHHIIGTALFVFCSLPVLHLLFIFGINVLLFQLSFISKANFTTRVFLSLSYPIWFFTQPKKSFYSKALNCICSKWLMKRKVHRRIFL